MMKNFKHKLRKKPKIEITINTTRFKCFANGGVCSRIVFPYSSLKHFLYNILTGSRYVSNVFPHSKIPQVN